MKIALLADTHFGVRNSSAKFMEESIDFFHNCFFPYIKEHGIKDVIHLGDVMDQRKTTNTLILSLAKDEIMDPMLDMIDNFHWIIGNHDTYYKNTNFPNVSEAFENYQEITLYENVAEEVEIGGTKFLFVPWINSENQDETLMKMKSTNARIVMGHFEIQGFEMTRGKYNEDGLSQKAFSGFEAVYSGHFHIPGELGNIKYLGSPYQMDWNDAGSTRGFYIFDTEDHSLEFVPNPREIFQTIEYDDKHIDIWDIDPAKDVDAFDVEKRRGAFVRVIVERCHSPATLEYLIGELEDVGADVKVIDNVQTLNFEADDLEIDEAEGTLSIIHRYVESLDEEKTIKGLDDLMVDLYNEAQNL